MSLLIDAMAARIVSVEKDLEKKLIVWINILYVIKKNVAIKGKLSLSFEKSEKKIKTNKRVTEKRISNIGSNPKY